MNNVWHAFRYKIGSVSSYILRPVEPHEFNPNILVVYRMKHMVASSMAWNSQLHDCTNRKHANDSMYMLFCHICINVAGKYK
jgi:hypothetical protein